MLEAIDAPLADSSPAAETATEEIAQAVPEVTAASPGAQAETTPSAKTELDEFKAEVARASGKELVEAQSETEADETAPKTDDEPEAEVKAQEQDPEVLSQEKQDEKVPEKLTDRPEWLAATKIADKLGKAAGVEMRGILRGLYKTQHDLAQTVEKSKPSVEVVQEMFQSVGGSEQGFRNMRHLIKSFDSDPTKAVPMLETLLNDAKKRAGLVLQSPELLTEAQALDKQVTDGLMDKAVADKRKAELIELQKARTGTERTQAQIDAERQRQQRAQSAQKQQAAVNEIHATAESWEKEKLASDPDYLPLKSLHTSLTFMLAEAEVQKLGRMLTGKEARAIADEALKQVKEEVGKLLPKRTAKVAVSGGNGSSSQHRQQPTTEFEEFQATVEAAKKRH